MGSWEFVEGGGALEMAVPGLASFLAFLSRPDSWCPKVGEGEQAEGGLLGN